MCDVCRQSWGVGAGAPGCKGRGYRRYTAKAASTTASNSNVDGGGSSNTRKSRTYRSETWVAGQYYGHIVVTSHKSVLDFEFQTPGGERTRNTRSELSRHDRGPDHNHYAEKGGKGGKAAETKPKKKRKDKARKSKPPKHPHSSYILFVVDTRPGIARARPDLTASAIMGQLSELWDELGAAGQESFTTRAKTMKDAYDLTLKAYNATVIDAAAAAAAAAVVATAAAAAAVVATAAAAAAGGGIATAAPTFPPLAFSSASPLLSTSESPSLAPEWVTPELTAMYTAAFAKMVLSASDVE